MFLLPLIYRILQAKKGRRVSQPLATGGQAQRPQRPGGRFWLHFPGQCYTVFDFGRLMISKTVSAKGTRQAAVSGLSQRSRASSSLPLASGSSWLVSRTLRRMERTPRREAGRSIWTTTRPRKSSVL